MLLVDDDIDCLAEFSDLVEDLDLTCHLAQSAEDALRLLGENSEIGIIVCDVRMPGTDGLAFLSMLQAHPQPYRPLQTILVSGHSSTALVVSALRLGATDFLTKPTSRQEYQEALQRAMTRYEQATAGLSLRASEAERLSRLSEEVSRIAKALSNLAQTGEAGAPPLSDTLAEARPAAVTSPEDSGFSASLVRSIIRGRAARYQFFDRALFADPAWDILLDLTAARLECKRVSVSSLCIAAGVPSTTALRWIKEMTSIGLLVRRSDPTDGRRIFIDLSDEAFARMESFLRVCTSRTTSC